MFGSKYGKVLTVILIVLIVIIIGLLVFFGYEKIKKENDDKDAMVAIEEFDRKHNVNANEETEPSPEVEATPGDEDMEGLQPLLPNAPGGSSGGSSSSSSSGNSDGKIRYKGFVMVGHIQIPKTNIKYPILEKVTIKSLETSVAILYPADAKLNEPGNVVIAGHNYRNQMFFSNNKKLSAGDKIYITDESGRKLTYVVYDNFEAAPEDTSFYIRDTGGVPEITLTTCTQDSSKRTIILAKAE